MLDARSYRVLEALASLRDTHDDIYKGYFLPITLAPHLGLDVHILRDEYDLLAAAGYVRLKPYPDGDRTGTLAIVTPAGDAALAARRKIADASGQAAATVAPRDRYDIFLSHASDDNDYALPLHDALSANFNVFIDKTGLRAGANFPRDIPKAIAASDWGLFLLTPSFIAKGYTREELDTFLHREIQTQRRQTVIVTRGMSFTDVEAYNTLLAKRLQLDADRQPLSEIVREIALVVRPPAISLDTRAVGISRTKLYPEGPDDALPDQPQLVSILPRIDFVNEGVRHDGARVDISFALQSVGPGDCYNLAYFLPALDQGCLPHRVNKDRPLRRALRLDQTPAYREYVKAYYKAVFEFEDVAGNLYRQYGDVHQTGDSVFSNYSVDNITRPFLVAQRIIKL